MGLTIRMEDCYLMIIDTAQDSNQFPLQENFLRILEGMNNGPLWVPFSPTPPHPTPPHSFVIMQPQIRLFYAVKVCLYEQFIYNIIHQFGMHA